MKLFPILLVLNLICFEQKLKSQEIGSNLSKLYFNADISKFDTSLINFYKNDTRFTYFTLDMIESNPKNEFKKYDHKLNKFSFSHNPILGKDSIAGYISLFTDRKNSIEEVNHISISFTNLNKKETDRVFQVIANTLIKNFSKTETIRKFYNMPNIKYFIFNQIIKIT